jgi:hypothetical protein
MEISEKIARESKNLTDGIKDIVSQNVLIAAKNNIIRVDDNQLPQLINVIEASFSEAFQKALPVYQKSIKRYLEK